MSSRRVTGPAGWHSVKASNTRRSSGAAIRNDAESPLAFDAVGFEIVVIDGENGRERLPLRQVDQGGIREIHRPVAITMHQRLEVCKGSVPYRQDADRAGAE